MASFVQRLSAWVALVAFSTSFGLGWSAASHFVADNDADCGQVELAGSHPGPQFEAAKTSLPTSHCAFCHWQRLVSGANLSAIQHASLHLRPIGGPAAAGSRAPRSAALDQHSSRGPPARV